MNNSTALNESIERLGNAWRTPVDDEDEKRKRIMRNGDVLHVRMIGDRAASPGAVSVTDYDAIAKANAESNQRVVDAAQRDADRAQAFADHFTAQREAQRDDSAYSEMCHDLSTAWQGGKS